MTNSELQNRFSINTDKSKLDLDVIHNFLRNSYWAKNIPLSVVQKCIDNSFCFGVYEGDKQVGFARVITDYASFAYFSDVFILEEYRGFGLGKWLIETIMAEAELQGLRRWLLATKDAHWLYGQFGFEELKTPEWFMEIFRGDVYKDANR
ncbi:GNAT family N-acetyltransferase [Planktothrix sp. FACHB-1355]|uniref:GNAT family N-acetyltransferase n=1 Tax=Aerosakkonema funiforme FACHB-1375 TaxID=2949571 RepID=A0A926VCF0_9CYAN|nr:MULTISPECIES: GNAT family N-acetyltransferase [Oscillatoriales]MBD2181228.1 GNAT family N-acetyltransferase [Aerosakkonema funiforme FACHB-1375]MBD3559898.1 GNAT family N-acetyltransferase [Planktothrix sp. FACHB-1355]